MRSKKFTFILGGIIVIILLLNVAFAATKTFRVKETDFVKIRPETVDLDNDQVVVYYSPPLDEQGEWQTDYDDAGEYEIEVVASDGIDQSVEKIKLIVEDKNQPPVITESNITVKETQRVDLKELIDDPDKDVLSYRFNPPFDKEGLWETSYDDEGVYLTEFIVSDGEYSVKAVVEIEVLKTNQPPTIEDTFSESATVNIKENEKLEFWIKAGDEDEDVLTYHWEFDHQPLISESSGEYNFDYESSGEHSLKVTVSDGINEASEEWTINVADVNRQPEIDHLPVTVNEGELVVLDFPEYDLDGDSLVYTYQALLDEGGRWQTGYDEAGEYELTVTANDGEYSVEEVVKITVIDVDRAPALELPEKLEVKEEEELSWFIVSEDLDGDEISLKVEGLPEEAIFDEEEQTVTWTPEYDYIKRKGGLISNVLNSFRLERFLLKQKTLPLTVTSCGKELCTTKETKLVVYNVNRAPEFTNTTENLTFAEGERIELKVEAVDPDEDIVHYQFSSPLGKRTGRWETDYEDAGSYDIDVSASDGQLKRTLTLLLEVTSKNREPALKIKDDQLVVNEGEELRFEVKADDPDEDNLTLWLKDFPLGAAFNEGTFSWTPDHDTVTNKTNDWITMMASQNSYLNKKFGKDEETVWLAFVASDGEFETVHPVKVVVKNVNRAPEIIDYLPEEKIEVKAGVPLIFHVAAKDADEETLNYAWEFGLKQVKVKGTDTIERTFVSPGEKKVKVTVSDGLDSVIKEWRVNVYQEMIVKPTIVPVIKKEPVTIKVMVIEG